MTTAVFGGRVLQARVLRSVPSGVLAERLGWRADKLTRVERRHTVLLPATDVAQLRRLLRVPEVFLTTAPVAQVQERDLLFRTLASTTQREKTYLTQFMAAVEELAGVATRVRAFPPVRLPRGRFHSALDTAAAAREALRVDRGAPVKSVTMAAEKAGVLVVMRSRGLALPDAAAIGADVGSTSERHSGLSAWVGEFAEQPVILMQAMSSWERTRWTLAHELGHLCLHKDLVGLAAEEQANAFAGEFLAPVDAVTADLPAQVTLTALIDVKMRWGISIGALIMHLARHGVVDPSRAKTLQRQIYTRKNPATGRSWGMDEPGWDARVPERPRMLMKWLENTTGTQSALQMTAFPGVVFPADLLAEMIAHQRTGPHDPAATAHAASGGDDGPTLATVSVLGRPR